MPRMKSEMRKTPMTRTNEKAAQLRTTGRPFVNSRFAREGQLSIW